MVNFLCNLIKRTMINVLPDEVMSTIRSAAFDNIMSQTINDMSKAIINANDMGAKTINFHFASSTTYACSVSPNLSRVYFYLNTDGYKAGSSNTFAEMCRLIELKLNEVGYKTQHTDVGGSDCLFIITVFWSEA
jgi:hypothetical protein